MNQETYNQINNLLEKSQKILILAHARVDCDGLGASLSLHSVLTEMGKEVTVATNDPAPDNLHFLPSIDILKNSLAGSTDFIITVDAEQTDIGNVAYNIEGKKINIIITPKNGNLSDDNVSFVHGKNKFDLIFVLDTGNLEHLGAIYDANTEMFFETPVINIDHHTSNTDFGQVNLVDVTASSTTEILYEYLVELEKQQGKKLITEDIATLLLAGIITDTGSFQHANTSPRAMETSSKLLDLGARQQEIIKNIYKTKKLSTLKLWGIILSKVQVDPVHRMVWSTINKNDLQEAEADPDETEGIIDDLLTNAPGAEIIFLIKENPDYVSVSMRSTNNQTDVGKLCADNGGGGHIRAAGFKIKGDNRPFEEITSEVIGKVRKFQADKLNIQMGDAQNVQTSKFPDNQTDAQTPPKEPDNQPQNSQPSQQPVEEKETYLDFKAPNKKKIGVRNSAPESEILKKAASKSTNEPNLQQIKEKAEKNEYSEENKPSKSQKRRARRKKALKENDKQSTTAEEVKQQPAAEQLNPPMATDVPTVQPQPTVDAAVTPPSPAQPEQPVQQPQPELSPATTMNSQPATQPATSPQQPTVSQPPMTEQQPSLPATNTATVQPVTTPHNPVDSPTPAPKVDTNPPQATPLKPENTPPPTTDSQFIEPV